MITTMGGGLGGYNSWGYSFGAADPNAEALQRGLNALAAVVKDTAIGVTVDGIIGPGTTRAYNLAAKKYLTVAPAKGRTGNLSQAIVRQYAQRFAGFIKAEIEKRQGKKTAPAATAPTPAPDTAAIRTLQKAIVGLGAQRKDNTLRITVDGKVGPQTTSAANRALTRYAKNAPAALRTGKLTAAAVRTNAVQIAKILEDAVKSYKAEPVRTTAPTPAPVLVSKSQIHAMQSALAALGTLAKDATLKITADGIVGPRTVTAVNRALTKYAPSAQFKPPLSLASVKRAVPTLTPLFQAAVAKRRGAPPTKQTVTPSQPVPAPASAPTPVKPTARVNVARLQGALIELGSLLGDRTLLITKDGIVGPQTTKAVNHAFKKYVRSGPASLKQTLSVAQVNALADELTNVLNDELSRRRAEARAKTTPKPATPPPAPTPLYPDDDDSDAGEDVEAEAAPSPAPPPARQTVTRVDIGPAEIMPSPPTEEKKTPWGIIIGVGAGAVVLGGLAVAAFSNNRAP